MKSAIGWSAIGVGCAAMAAIVSLLSFGGPHEAIQMGPQGPQSFTPSWSERIDLDPVDVRALSFPLVMAALGLAAAWLRRATWLRIGTMWVVAAALWVFCAASMLSVGVLYIPAATALTLAALQSRRGCPSGSRITEDGSGGDTLRAFRRIVQRCHAKVRPS
jgi:hypothetical protein